MLLEAGEKVRAQSYLTVDHVSGYIAADGKAEEEWGPSQHARLGLSLATTVAESYTLSVDLPTSTNYHHKAGSDTALADPGVTLHKAFANRVWGMAFLRPGVLISYKYAWAKGLDEVPDKEYSLDIHGNGAGEYKIAFDLDVSNFVWGVFLRSGVFKRQDKTVDWYDGRETRRYGYGFSQSVAVYRSYMGSNRLSLELDREDKGLDRIAGEEIPDSSSKSHLLLLRSQTRVGTGKTLSIAIGKKGFVGLDQRTKSAFRTELAFSQNFL